MNPGAILTEAEKEKVLDRLSQIILDCKDRRIREQCRMASLTILRGERRAKKYNKEQAELLKMIESAL